MQRGLITGLTIGILLVIFALQNVVQVQIKLLLWELPELPLVLVILATLLLGVLVNALSSWPVQNRLRRQNNQLQQRIDQLEEDLVELRQQKEERETMNEEGELIKGDPNTNLFEE